MDKKSDHNKAKQLLKRYGGEVDDYFKLYPDSKNYFFASDDKAFIAFSVKNNVAFCLGDPAGNPQSIHRLLDEFSKYIKEQGWLCLFIQTTAKNAAEYRRIGLKGLVIGADASVDINKFLTTTVKNKYFRNIVNGFNKQNLKVQSYSPPHSSKLINELHSVSRSWLSLPHRKEWSFLTGAFKDDYLQQVRLHVLRDSKNTPLAFANELPVYKQGVASIDLMRHRADAPRSSIDMLFIAIMDKKKTEGFKQFNIGLSPLDGEPFISKRIERVLHSLYKTSNSFIGFKGLHQFKSKYNPNWEPRYIWFKGSYFDLIKIGWALFRLMTSD